MEGQQAQADGRPGLSRSSSAAHDVPGRDTAMRRCGQVTSEEGKGGEARLPLTNQRIQWNFSLWLNCWGECLEDGLEGASALVITSSILTRRIDSCSAFTWQPEGATASRRMSWTSDLRPDGGPEVATST